ncbi:MAG TPA: 5,10-methylenetetrahydrofolate reductase [Thermoanaerobacterales bacterium]|nr:5,10-methylenetetrahydrofolate reductase [Thermoanaerobacterales bacterium]
MSSNFKNKLKSGQFTVTVEISSPKGTYLNRILQDISELKDMADAVNICDNPMAHVRMGSIQLAHIIQEKAGMEAIPHMTCRDRNIIGIQSELLGAWALGIKNIFAVTGDTPDKGDHPGAAGVFEVDSKGLIRIIDTLNNGRDLANNTLEGSTDFFIGTAANPAAEDLGREIEKMKEKIDCGANFIQTQPVYDMDVLDRFLEKALLLDVPILVGIMPLKSQRMAINFNSRVEGVNIPLKIIDRMKRGRREGVEISRELAEGIRERGCGIHLMPLGDVEAAVQIIKGIGLSVEKVNDASGIS